MANLTSIWDGLPHTTKRPKITVVVPALNEARNLPHVAARMPTDVDEVVFVDGNSVDGTAEVARQLWPNGIHINQTRKGKGNALACGFEAASGDIIVMLDADGSTDPAEIPSYVGALVAGADFAKGSRFIQGGGSSDITTLRRFGNKGLNGLVNMLFATRYTDLCYGYNAFWRHCLDVMKLPDTDIAESSVGRRLRDRDVDQRPSRGARPQDLGGFELREEPHPRSEQSQRVPRRNAGVAHHPPRVRQGPRREADAT